MAKSNRLLPFLGCLFLLAVVSCGDDEDDPITPTPPTPVVIYNSSTSFITEENSWSAVEYTDVTLCEVHSEISDFELRSTPPEGYNVYLKKQPEKDNAGMYVYRIVCDMPPVSKVTTSNANERIQINYILSGNGYTDGVWGKKEYEKRVEFTRYDAPEEEPKALAHAWYLAEHSIVDNVNKEDFEDKYSSTTTKIENSYSFDSSPIRMGYTLLRETYYDEFGNEVEKRTLYLKLQCTKSLPGWVETELMFINGKLVNTRFEIPEKPLDYGASVYFISDDKLLAMKGEYTSNGDLLKIHYYVFYRPRQE